MQNELMHIDLTRYTVFVTRIWFQPALASGSASSPEGSQSYYTGACDDHNRRVLPGHQGAASAFVMSSARQDGAASRGQADDLGFGISD